MIVSAKFCYRFVTGGGLILARDCAKVIPITEELRVRAAATAANTSLTRL